MSKESRGPRPEQKENTLQLLPVELAKTFVDGSFLDEAPKVRRGHISTTYRCLQRDEYLPGIERAKLNVDYREYDKPSPERLNQMCFEYTQTSLDNPEIENRLAQMHLRVVDLETYVLNHRYVHPELRNIAGVGTQLLKTAESWLQQVAQELGHPVDISLQTGQASVIKWIQKMGYAVKPEHEALLLELKQHPENFFEAAAVLSPDEENGSISKDLYTFKQGTSGRQLVDAIRLGFEKHIKNTP